MSKAIAAAGSAAFFALAPGVMAGLVPWWLTGWEAQHTWPALRVLGAALIAAGLVVLVQAFVRFVVEGVGTPAPVAPTEHLVVGGLYRYVRNVMYVAVAATIVGQALVLGPPRAAALRRRLRRRHRGFGRWYEEPTRGKRFGAEYEAYRRAVPGWAAATAPAAPARVVRQPERPKPCWEGPTCSPSQRTSGTAASSSLAPRARPWAGAAKRRARGAE